MKCKTFAKGDSFFKYFWIFILICILGYVYESILSIFQHGTFLNRQGLIFGPFIPVYGLGAVFFMLTLKNIEDIKIQFLIGTIVGGFLEYIYSYIQDKVFGTISWDYSDYILNFDGRTSILHAIFWGILGVIFIKKVYPFLSKYIEKIPIKIGNILTYILIIFMCFNIYISILVSLRQNSRHANIAPQNVVDNLCDKYFPNEKLNKIYSNHKKT